ncbi:hypothetical protein OQA88_8940 [Cercophora sp. LCS_1]
MAETKPAPLAFMTALTPSIALHIPPSASSIPEGHPKLILLCTWLAARDAHILKYITPYQALYPHSPILLVRSFHSHFLNPPKLQAELIRVAIPVVRNHVPSDSTPTDTDTKPTTGSTDAKPKLLIHLLSGGGSQSLALLRTAPSFTLPPHTTVYDSAPPQFHYWGSYLATVGGLSKWMRRLLAPIVHILCCWFWIEHKILWRKSGGSLGETARVHNSAVNEVRRTYVYGPGDVLVRWRDVEAHAVGAKERGYVVRAERFEGTEHVAHVRGDGERYWGLCRGNWEGW